MEEADEVEEAAVVEPAVVAAPLVGYAESSDGGDEFFDAGGGAMEL